MKNDTQVYVKNSMEAAKTYCKAFGAEITIEHNDFRLIRICQEEKYNEYTASSRKYH